MVTKEKDERIRNFYMYIAMFIPVLIFSNVLVYKFAREIIGINFIMNVIAVPCCVIYYKITKKNNVFLYTLFFLSLLIDNLYSYLAFRNSSIDLSLPLHFIFRFILVILIVFDFRIIIERINKNKIAVSSVFIAASIFSIILDSISESMKFKSLKSEHVVIVGVSLGIVIFLRRFKGYFKEREFMENIFLYSLSLIIFRRIVISLNSIYLVNIIDQKVLFCFAFYILMVGLFVECSYLIKENMQLEKEVKIISEDIKGFQEIEKIRTQFFANISHELKTPINVIFSAMQLIESKRKYSEEFVLEYYNKYESIMKQNCYRIIRLTNNLVDLTKFETGSMEMNFKNMDIVKLIEDITISAADYVKNKNINIVFDTLIEEKVIKCDKDGIQRILLNLISNSIKFIGESGNILVFMELKDDYVVIRVKDDGIGISKENKETMFNIFVQGDKSLNRIREGSGIGLSLVKAIVEKHDGYVKCEDVDIGTEVVIRLPDKILEEWEECEEIQEIDTSCEKDIILKINTEFSDIY